MSDLTNHTQKYFNKNVLHDYLVAFENLTPANLETDLAPLLAEDIFFKDPFNAVTGRQATLNIFKHMFATTEAPKFKVISYAADGLDEQVGLLYWVFDFKLPANHTPVKIEGMSRVTFNPAGLVQSHIDYWDAGEQVYAKVPLLGWGIRQVIKRLSANQT